MFVVAEFCGQRLVYFEPPGQYPASSQPEVVCCPCARERNGAKQHHRHSTLAVELPNAVSYVVPAKDFKPPSEYMDLDTFLSMPTRRVDTTTDSNIDPPAHCLDIC